jgi:CheY-like chemotaxis protein
VGDESGVAGRGGSAAGTGYGITGMRERAALPGGDFSAGPRPGGGFRVEQTPGIDVAGEAGTGAEAVQLVRDTSPDVVVMDIRMPGMDGIEATRLITAGDGRARVLVLTTFDDDDYVYGALRAGASGFLVKDMALEDILTAIRVVAGGDAIIAPGVTRRLIGQFASQSRPDFKLRELTGITDREREAEQVKARLASWLAPRGLAFNEDKTRIVTPGQGFGFLGFNVRRYHGKLLIKPSKTAVRRIRERLRTEIRSLRGANAQAVIARLNPIIRGWAAYYRTAVSSEVFAALDHYLWRLTYKWARHSHPNKPARWVIRRYFGTFNKSRQDRWVFGDRDSGAYLLRFAWTRIVRHQMVRGTSSPDDPALASYWADRRRRGIPRPMDIASLRLLEAQHGCCPSCGELLLDADRPPQSPREWEQWLAVTRKAMIRNAIAMRADKTPDEATLRLLHAHCHRQYARSSKSPALLPASQPQGLA